MASTRPSPLIGFYVDTPDPLRRSVPLALRARAELLAGECLLASGDKLLITYKEQPAAPGNISVKQDPTLGRLSPRRPPASLCQDAPEPETEVERG